MSDSKSSRPRRQRRLLRRFVSTRRAVQLGVGVALYFAVVRFQISLLVVIAAGSALGIVFGKFFCRWMCPMGAMMELMLGAGGDADGRQKSLYNYFKLGCPIAWAGGLLNRFSLLRVKLDRSQCTDCGACDKACYVAQLAPGRSLHTAGLLNASAHYSCSRCLSCVGACPTGALSIGLTGSPTLTGPAVRPEAR